MDDNTLDEMFLSRQLVLDRQQEIVGYEISIVPAIVSDEPMNYNPQEASMLICSIYSELGIRSALGNSIAFIKIDSEFLFDDMVELLSSKPVVLELIMDKPVTDQLVEKCKDLKVRKFSLAYSDYVGLDKNSSPLLALVDIIKIDIRKYNKEELILITSPISRLPIKILAYGIDNQESIDLCMELGFDYFQGNYFSRPEIISGRTLTASQISIIDLINLTNKEVSNETLENRIKHEPALSVNLLCIVNSADRGLNKRISSLGSAIIMLGRKRLQRWLQLLLLAPFGKMPNITKTPILQVAALRGSMMESLVKYKYKYNNKLLDQAFITGVISMLPLALGIQMSEIITYISLEDEIVEALTAHTGRLGEILRLIESYDSENVIECNALIKDLDISAEVLNTTLISALQWINNTDD